MDRQKISRFNIRLGIWYRKNKRDFPWRRSKQSYNLLIAEILLQKTNADKVVPAYNEIIRRYPNPNSLKKARIGTLEKIIQPLGLINKAYILRDIGKKLSKINENELTLNKLLEIKGIGNYIARSVLIHSKGLKFSLLDPNFIRIYSRVFDLQSDRSRPRNDVSLWLQAEELLPSKNISKYCYSILDFGAIVCTARKTICCECPMFSVVCSGVN
ncbi:MAG: hypothetical protein PVF83_03810 [Anaerolineales bacterium]|jgi:A/G-specific adenine glycosylase